MNPSAVNTPPIGSIALPFQLAKRLQNVSWERAASVARAMGRAGGSYARDDDNFKDDLNFFDSTIDSALRTSTTRRSDESRELARRTAMTPLMQPPRALHKTKDLFVVEEKYDHGDNYEGGDDRLDPQNTSELSDLVNILADSANDLIARQTAEITCLRMAVKELILEILEGADDKREIPGELAIQDDSAEIEDPNMNRLVPRVGTAVSPPRRSNVSTKQNNNDRIRRGPDVHANIEHREPGGQYELNRSLDVYVTEEEERKMSVLDVLDKIDPPLKDEKVNLEANPSDPPVESHWDHDSLKEKIHEQLNGLRTHILNYNTSTPIGLKRDPALKEAMDSVGEESTAVNKKKTTSELCIAPHRTIATGVPVKERLRSIVEAQRDRFHRFHGHQFKEETRSQILACSVMDPPTPPRRKKNASQYEQGLLANPSEDEPLPPPLSPHVRLKEEDLTLLETTPKRRQHRRRC